MRYPVLLPGGAPGSPRRARRRWRQGVWSPSPSACRVGAVRRV